MHLALSVALLCTGFAVQSLWLERATSCARCQLVHATLSVDDPYWGPAYTGILLFGGPYEGSSIFVNPHMVSFSPSLALTDHRSRKP